ncbi:MAG TPA: hypothetical protein VJT69_10475 [Pyrinomonadaceae bacterium]|nr:hypothetical protein [Pyrinomonadaceae bacterium]
MSIFKITINPGPPAKFSPNPQVVVSNDTVFWFNGDKIPHWPAPSKSNPTGFISYQIPPNDQSSEKSFVTTGTVNYVCILHDGETGQITVKTPKAVSFGKKTKKGGFGGKTKKGPFAAKTKKSAYAAKTRKSPFGSTTKK